MAQANSRMQSALKEAAAQAAAMFIFFSEILDSDVKCADGVTVGRVWDISPKLGDVYPRAGELIVTAGTLKRLYASVPWSSVDEIDGDIILTVKSSDLVFSPDAKTYEFLLRRDILDQQVVDTFNHKVRRVNDIHLLKVEKDLVIAHVDIGLRGLVRRLGIEKIVDWMVRIFHRQARYLTRDDMVSWKFVQPVAVMYGGMTMKLSMSEKQLLSIPPADLGDVIFDLNPNQRIALFRALDPKLKARVFENLDFEEQKTILRDLEKKEAAQIIANMSSDEAADLLERLPRATIKNILTLVESTQAKKLSTLLGYASDSAGGLMTTEFVALSEAMKIDAALTYITTQTKEFDIIHYVYLIDEKNQLKGTTTIRRLLMADPADAIIKTILPKTVYVYLNNSVKEVAYLMERYKLSAIPVIDENKILQGIITIDDILRQVVSIAWRKRSRTEKGIYYE